MIKKKLDYESARQKEFERDLMNQGATDFMLLEGIEGKYYDLLKKNCLELRNEKLKKKVKIYLDKNEKYKKEVEKLDELEIYLEHRDKFDQELEPLRQEIGEELRLEISKNIERKKELEKLNIKIFDFVTWSLFYLSFVVSNWWLFFGNMGFDELVIFTSYFWLTVWIVIAINYNKLKHLPIEPSYSREIYIASIFQKIPEWWEEFKENQKKKGGEFAPVKKYPLFNNSIKMQNVNKKNEEKENQY
jgi:hypothetical protein